MKHTRVRLFVKRLTAWHDPYPDIRHQPFVMIEREISIEDAKRMFGFIPVAQEPQPSAMDRLDRMATLLDDYLTSAASPDRAPSAQPAPGSASAGSTSPHES